MKYHLLSIAALIALASCGNSENPDARDLFNSAEQSYASGDYTNAIFLLDSLQRNYPQEFKIQREAMALRPQIIEQLSIAKIASVDSMTLADNAAMESLKPLLKWVKTPGMIEGYWVDAKAFRPDFMNSTGLEARVSEIGQFYIVSSVNPSSIKHTSVTLTLGEDSATTPEVPYDGESNYRIGGGEVITFSPEQSDTIGAFASAYKGASPKNMTLTFNGQNGKKTVKLTAAQVNGIANAYQYSFALVRARDNMVEKQRLEKTVEIAKRQTETALKALEDK